MSRERNAVAIKDRLGWSYTRALYFVRDRREEAIALAEATRVPFVEAVVALARAAQIEADARKDGAK